jgi:hypothetical protein
VVRLTVNLPVRLADYMSYCSIGPDTGWGGSTAWGSDRQLVCQAEGQTGQLTLTPVEPPLGPVQPVLTSEVQEKNLD